MEQGRWNRGREARGQGDKGAFALLDFGRTISKSLSYQKIKIFHWLYGTQVYYSYDAFFEARFDLLSCVKVPKLNHI